VLALAAEQGAAVLAATHDPTVAARFPHRWTLADGHLETKAV
jgi:ABC-type lipoprotein export system ATPase subunit